MKDKKNLPLVYSCSGCSSAAQMANFIALELDRRELADMSCIAGVGGGVGHLVRIAQSGRPILALDGCKLECVKSSLAQRQVSPTQHVMLQEHGIKKKYHTDFDRAEANLILEDVAQIAKEMTTCARLDAAPLGATHDSVWIQKAAPHLFPL